MSKKKILPTSRPMPTTPRAKFIERCFDILGWETWQREHFSGKLKIEWTTGGQTGGSCWDTSTPVYSSRESDPEPDFEELEILLQGLRPQISFLQYRELCRKLIKKDIKCDDDYYGNYTNRAIKSIDLGELFDYFQEQGWFEDQPSAETATADLNGLLAALGATTVDEALTLITRNRENP